MQGVGVSSCLRTLVLDVWDERYDEVVAVGWKKLRRLYTCDTHDLYFSTLVLWHKPSLARVLKRDKSARMNHRRTLRRSLHLALTLNGPAPISAAPEDDRL